MLKYRPPSQRRRLAGAAVLMCVLTGFTGAVYAVSQSGNPGPGVQAAGVPAAAYQLDVYAQKSTGASGSRLEHATVALCTAVGEAGSFMVGEWKVRTAVDADGASGVRVTLSVVDANDASLATSKGRTRLGQALHSDLTSPDGKDHFAFVVTPRAGCPAREEAASTAAKRASSVVHVQPGLLSPHR